MNTIQLEDQWSRLKGQKNSGFITLRIDANCKPDLNLGINSKKNRCLLLMLPKGFNIDFIGETKENIKTSYNRKDNCIVLELLDGYYHNLFDDLIISLYFKINKIEDVKESTSIFISTINKWASFLANARGDKLTKEVIKGLYGELTVVDELLIKSSLSDVNEVLQSWQGPYDANTDFIFDKKNIEVKTKNYDSSIIRISSEFQLDDELGKELELLVVSLETDNNLGEDLEALVNKLKGHILDANGDVSILFEALAQKNLFTSNLKEYSNYKFTLKKHETYSCNMILENNEVFPRLMDTLLPDYIKKVKYNINLQELNSFIVAQKIF
ncbi:PD-(D/E)XK motif protein [Polaribacter sp. PL03]|uniref:PD-(D/E)XK motif protein n=1 Tax=Polaribacter sp. PL03 TaxID=3088353 RepID=UPI0029D1B954|nr:PD-(D/E)XK motif protein [Polaribacter sp. PL03]MDX6746829.1 PD-(D/E)XK motif protein [Polaribacter sp. PL03]